MHTHTQSCETLIGIALNLKSNIGRTGTYEIFRKRSMPVLLVAYQWLSKMFYCFLRIVIFISFIPKYVCVLLWKVVYFKFIFLMFACRNIIKFV